jgi:protein involved in polysaccharide export with SLBB domain
LILSYRNSGCSRLCPFGFDHGKLSMRRSIGRFCASARHWLPIFYSVLILACAPTDTMRIGAKTSVSTASSAATYSESANPAELAKLESLWNERQITASRNEDYPIGPGDVLTVSVPDVEQLTQRRVRVSSQGTIELPMLGIVQAGGLSEDELATEIDDKLQKYMYHPEANVFVDEYHNREVAVVGAVNHPGIVLLTNPSESLLDIVTQAGGLSSEAADEVILIPSRPGTISNSSRLASLVTYPFPAGESGNGIGGGHAASANFVEPSHADRFAFEQAGQPDWRSSNQAAQVVQPDAAVEGTASTESLSATSAPNAGLGMPSLAAHVDARFAAGAARGARSAVAPVSRTDHSDVVEQRGAPDSDEALQLAGGDDAVTIKLKGENLAEAGKYVNMPMRPGDVLIVPGGGDVMVVGWVQQPGRFQAGSGLTVLGAISAAGGPMYAAKTNSIVLIRTGKNGSKITIPINMDQITHGQAVDPPVQANDVIDVPYSGLRIGPYIFYSILTRVGLTGPIIPY